MQKNLVKNSYSLNHVEKTLDLVDIFEDYAIDFKEVDTHFILNECPDCSGKDKLFIDKKNKMWVCFKCAETDQFNNNKEGRGNLYSFLQRKIGMEPALLRKIYSENRSYVFTGDMDFELMENSQPLEKKENLQISFPKRFKKLFATPTCRLTNKEVYNYLDGRNVTEAGQIISFGLMYDEFQKRIIFPVVDIKNRLVGYQSRDITDRWKTDHPKCENIKCREFFDYKFFQPHLHESKCISCENPIYNTFYPKSKNSKDFPKTEIFFNENNIDPKYPITIVEGPFDCINVFNSVACLGKVLSDTQFHKLCLWKPPEVIVYMDGDIHGARSLVAIYNQICPFFDNISIVKTPSNCDPGDFNLFQNLDFLKKRVSFQEWDKKFNKLFL